MIARRVKSIHKVLIAILISFCFLAVWTLIYYYSSIDYSKHKVTNTFVSDNNIINTNSSVKRYQHFDGAGCKLDKAFFENGKIRQVGFTGWIFQGTRFPVGVYLQFDRMAIKNLDKVCPEKDYEIIEDIGSITKCNPKVMIHLRRIRQDGSGKKCPVDSFYAVLDIRSL